jgi:hypothetical protein
MYGANPYISSTYNSQASIDRINSQIAELEKLKSQIPQQQTSQPTSLTQNFQISPTNREAIRYADSLEEVQRDMVVGDTPYFSKDMSVVWIKNIKGEVRTYELNEIVPRDEKDMQIELLMAQVNELKGMIENEQLTTNDNGSEDETNSSATDESTGTATKKDQPTRISRVSTSKKK